MTSDGGASDGGAREELLASAHARLDHFIEDLRGRCSVLAGGGSDPQVHSTVLGTAVLALQYARETARMVLGDLGAPARAELTNALDGLVETSPETWGGDQPRTDLDNIADRSARLLADIWMLGRLTVAADPHSWSNDVLVQQCLQVVAETHLAGRLRAELDGMFGETDEPPPG